MSEWTAVAPLDETGRQCSGQSDRPTAGHSRDLTLCSPGTALPFLRRASG